VARFIGFRIVADAQKPIAAGIEMVERRLSGHSAPRHTQPVAGRPCAACHTPSIRLENLAFTNHQIAVYRPANPVVTAIGRR
jgi:hypothetical protein